MSTNWKEEQDKLKKTFEFKDFREAMSWMQHAAFAIEEMQHHPEWKNVYNTVDVALTTHDEGNKITEKDRKLADKLDALYSRWKN